MMSEKDVKEMVNNIIENYDKRIWIKGKLNPTDWENVKEVLRALKVEVLLAFSEINKKTDEIKAKGIQLDILVNENADNQICFKAEREKRLSVEKENADLKEQGKELIKQLQIAEDDVQDLENESDGFNRNEARDDLD